jgi:DNA-binding IclR family transcriptional regulator
MSIMEDHEDVPTVALGKKPQPIHRTIDRVTGILEEVVYRPGMTFSELVRALGAAKSSVHGFIQGLLAKGWLYEEKGRFYLGPAAYGLTLASGQMRAGVVTNDDLQAVHEATNTAVFLGVRAGDHLIYVGEAGTDPAIGFDARTNIRRTLLETAGGKALLAALPDAERDDYLRRCDVAKTDLVSSFLDQYRQIRATRIATNTRRNGTRFAIATTVSNLNGDVVAALTLVGPTSELMPRQAELGTLLLQKVDEFRSRHADRRGVI